MDGDRFDSLAKLVRTWATRRSALALLTGLGLGALDSADTGARKSGRCKPRCGACERCKKGDCKRKNGKKRCEKGKCKSVCTASQVCQAGSCFPTGACPATTTQFCPTTGSSTACSTGTANCFCSLSAEGNVVCVHLGGGSCGTPSCTTSATCPAGEACVEFGSCCAPFGTPTRVCLPPCPTPTVAGTAAASEDM